MRSDALLAWAALPKDLLGLLPTAPLCLPLAVSPPPVQAPVLGLTPVSDCPHVLPQEAHPCGSLENSLGLDKKRGGVRNEEQMRAI